MRRASVSFFFTALHPRAQHVLRRHARYTGPGEGLDDRGEPPGPDDGLDLEKVAVRERGEVAGDVDRRGGLRGRGSSGEVGGRGSAKEQLVLPGARESGGAVVFFF